MSSDRNFLIAYYGIVIGLIIGGLQLHGASFAIFSGPLLILGSMLGAFPVVIRVVIFMFPAKVFTDREKSKKYVQTQLSKVCTHGGTIFSTYILEESNSQDIVSNAFAKKTTVNIEYQRLFMIDDPEKESAWITKFLAQKKENVTLSLFIIKDVNRVVGKFIRTVLPRINIFMVKHNNFLQDKVVHISFAPLLTKDGYFLPNLAIAIYSKKVYDALFKYCEKILCSKEIREIRSVEQYNEIQRQPALPVLTQKILNAVQDLAETNPDIIHIGVFGSVAKICKKTLVDRFSEEHENDLDFLIVVKDRMSREYVKENIFTSILPLNNTIEIDWSNESSEFYFFRRGYRIDIQLHEKNDTYYQANKLLGYSIFPDYYVLYTEERKSLNEILDIPINPSDFDQRKNIYLKNRLGLEDCIKHCASGNIKIDPRRILAINVKNFVWAMTGMRPISQRIANENIKNYFSQEIYEHIDQLVSANEDMIFAAHKEFMAKCVYVLEKIRFILVENSAK